MAALLDTSVLVRYLTLDPPPQGAEAQALIDSGEALVIPSVALVEAAFVLTKLYGVPREAAVDLLVDLVNRMNLAVLDIPKSQVIEALLLCRPSGRVSFADAVIWAAARSSGITVVYTFDQQFPAVDVDRRVLRAE